MLYTIGVHLTLAGTFEIEAPATPEGESEAVAEAIAECRSHGSVVDEEASWVAPDLAKGKG